MRLSELLASAGIAMWGGPDPDIVDLTQDSREVRPGWLFVAITGRTFDGHNYVAEAVARGAAAVVVERPVVAAVPTIVVADARAALADLAAAFYNFPSHHLRVIGVTGTDGKTTTCFLLASILEAAGWRTGLSTTVETRIGGRSRYNDSRMTTPDPATIQRLLGQMVGAGDQYAVVESSSHALAQGRLRGVTFHGAALTNIASDHLDFHGSREAYVAAKARLFGMVTASSEPHIALNRDDRSFWEISPQLRQPYTTYGTTAAAEVRASDMAPSIQGTRFCLHSPWGNTDIVLPLPGSFNVYNALAAATLALQEGVPLAAVRHGLATARSPAGRLERVDIGQDFTVFVDYAHTVQAFGHVLGWLHDLARRNGGRLIAVFGAAGSRDRSKRPELGRIAGQLADYFVITNEDPFGEDAASITVDIAAGAPQATKGQQWTIELDRRLAIKRALDQARAGDIVVITGKGHERSIVAAGQAEPWSDIEVVRELLSDHPL
jgi:UDP-N-acetylmuramoyl-L-alanyl-D-glutamate--2,6-diaminopimelate ligase